MSDTTKFVFRDLSPLIDNPSGRSDSITAIKKQLKLPEEKTPPAPEKNKPIPPKQKTKEEQQKEKWEQREKEFSEQLESAKKQAFDEGKQNGIEEGKKQGHEAGLEEGRGEVKALEEQSLAILTTIAETLGSFENTIEANISTLTQESITLALEISKKVTSGILDEHAEAIVTTALTRALEALTSMPEIIVYVNPSLTNTLQDKLQTLKTDKHLKGSVTLQADEALAVTDCKVTWDNGAFERNSQAIWDRIEALYQEAQSNPIAQKEAASEATLQEETPQDNAEPEETPTEAVPEAEDNLPSSGTDDKTL